MKRTSKKGAVRSRENDSRRTSRTFVAMTCVVVIVVVSIGMYLVGEHFGYVERSVLHAEMDHYNISRSKFHIIEVQGDMRLKTLRPIKEGEVITHIPRALCVTPTDVSGSDVGVFAVENKDAIEKAVAKSGGSFVQFKTIALFSVYLALERRNTLSPLQQWFQSLPQFDRNNGGGLFWEESDIRCLDAQATAEVRSLQEAFVTAEALATFWCSADEYHCPDGPLLDEDVRWGLAVYLHYNVRDQAIIPFLTFARFSAASVGVDVQLNRKTGGLNVVSQEALLEGAEMTLFYPRGPTSQLVSRGSFDMSATGIDAALDLRGAVNHAQGNKLCVEHAHELMFGSNGRPRAALLKCYAWLVGTERQRQQIHSHLTNKNWMLRVYGDLHEALSRDLNQNDKIHCAATDALRTRFAAVANFTKSVKMSNVAYLEQQMSLLQAGK